MLRRLRSRSSLVVVAVASASSLLALSILSSCSDDPPAAAPAEDAAGVDARKRTDGQTDPEEDAGTDAQVLPIVLPTCVGSSIPMNVSGVRAFVTIPLGTLPDGGREAKGEFVVDFGTTASTIDLTSFGDAGSEAPTPGVCNGDAAAPGASCAFQGFDFFGDWGLVYLQTSDHSTLFGTFRQAGIVATDFLSRNPFTLDFTHKLIFRSDVAAFCTETQLLGAGFRPLPTDGFYTTDVKKLRPLSEVLTDADAGTAGFTVPNVPTVPITIAGASALAQLDTGYEDRIARRSINVNEALLAQLNQQPGLLARDPSLDLFVTTCVGGFSEKLEGYHVAAGKVLEFIGAGGAVARTESLNAVYLKHRSSETYRCGGISTWTVPAAQVGASFFIDAQALILDPTSSRVWIPKD